MTLPRAIRIVSVPVIPAQRFNFLPRQINSEAVRKTASFSLQSIVLFTNVCKFFENNAYYIVCTTGVQREYIVYPISYEEIRKRHGYSAAQNQRGKA